MYKIEKNLTVTFLACLGANVFLCLGLLLSQRLYIDDIGRSIGGMFDWYLVGRPFADFVYFILNLGRPAVNVAPLNQLIALALISVACVVMARLIGGVRSPAAVALCTLSFGGQTYYLENLSYGFDCPTMTLGMLCSVLAAGLVLRTNGLAGFLLSVLLLLAALCLYQPTVTVYFIVFLFVFLRDIQVSNLLKRADLMRLARWAGVFTIAFVIYAKLILPAGSQNAYAKEHSTPMALNELAGGIVEHARVYWTIMYDDWKGTALGICAALVIAMGIALVGRAGKSTSGNNLHKLFFSLATVILLSLVVALSYGPPLALANPVWAPRTFVGIGTVLSVSSLHIFARTQWSSEYRNERVIAFILRAPVVVLAYGLVVAAYAFSQANSAQKDFEIAYVSRLLYDIDSINSTKRVNEISFIGTIPANPVLVNTARKFPLIDRLVPRHLSNDWWWAHMQLRTFGLPATYSSTDPGLRKLIDSDALHPLRDGQYYRLYLDKDHLVVRFSEDER